MKDKIPEITEIMKRLDKMRDEIEQTNPTSGVIRDLREIVGSLNDVRELMNW